MSNGINIINSQQPRDGKKNGCNQHNAKRNISEQSGEQQKSNYKPNAKERSARQCTHTHTQRHKCTDDEEHKIS